MAFQWSVSRLLTYLKCPYAYFLKYKERVSVPTPWYYLFGRVIHKAIEICHKGNPHQSFEPGPERQLFFQSPEKLGGFWLGLWKRETKKAIQDTGVLWKYPGQYQTLKGYGWALLAGTKDRRYRGYYHSITQPPFPIKVLEVEFRIKETLWGFPFVGIIDQLWETEEGTTIVDITTSRSRRTKLLQITAYQALLKQLSRKNSSAKQRFGVTPAQYLVWSLAGEKLTPVRPHKPEELKETLRHVANGVQFGKFPRTHQDYTCSACEYRKICNKVAGKSIPAGGGEKAEISLPQSSTPPQPKQLYFTEGAKGGWFRGDQVKGR